MAHLTSLCDATAKLHDGYAAASVIEQELKDASKEYYQFYKTIAEGYAEYEIAIKPNFMQSLSELKYLYFTMARLYLPVPLIDEMMDIVLKYISIYCFWAKQLFDYDEVQIMLKETPCDLKTSIADLFDILKRKYPKSCEYLNLAAGILSKNDSVFKISEAKWSEMINRYFQTIS